MATSSPPRLRIGPEHAGRLMTYDDFIAAEWTEGCLYELARGVVVVTEVPGINHGQIVKRVNEWFVIYDIRYRGRINYRAAGSDCRIRLPGMRSDRHPDQAVYLTPAPKGRRIWERWVPEIVVEVVSKRGEDRDYVEKREEYLRFGVAEYWIFDPMKRQLLVLTRAGNIWDEQVFGDGSIYQTNLLPGLDLQVGEILGPPVEPDEDEDVEVADA